MLLLDPGDFLFRDEWEKLEKDGNLKLHACFSRDQPTKHYVQHEIIKEKKKVLLACC